jgi:hypothetical protein
MSLRAAPHRGGPLLLSSRAASRRPQSSVTASGAFLPSRAASWPAGSSVAASGAFPGECLDGGWLVVSIWFAGVPFAVGQPGRRRRPLCHLCNRIIAAMTISLDRDFSPPQIACNERKKRRRIFPRNSRVMRSVPAPGFERRFVRTLPFSPRTTPEKPVLQACARSRICWAGPGPDAIRRQSSVGRSTSCSIGRSLAGQVARIARSRRWAAHRLDTSLGPRCGYPAISARTANPNDSGGRAARGVAARLRALLLRGCARTSLRRDEQRGVPPSDALCRRRRPHIAERRAALPTISTRRSSTSAGLLWTAGAEKRPKHSPGMSEDGAGAEKRRQQPRGSSRRHRRGKATPTFPGECRGDGDRFVATKRRGVPIGLHGRVASWHRRTVARSQQPSEPVQQEAISSERRRAHTNPR